MSASAAVFLWIGLAIALKLLLLALDPSYRRDYGRWLGHPATEGWKLIKLYPVREIGNYGAIMVLFFITLQLVRT